jgi:hypothetical protein
MAFAGRSWTTYLSSREMVARDGGPADAISSLKKGSPVVVQRGDTKAWECALFFNKLDDTSIKVLLADGSEAQVTPACRTLVGRLPRWHPEVASRGGIPRWHPEVASR